MNYYQQFDITDCGAACLAMIASHFGKKLNIAEIRKTAGTDIIGTNIKGLVDAAKKYGLNAYPVKGDKDSITNALAVPFICHFHIERDENDWKDHYVVVKKMPW